MESSLYKAIDFACVGKYPDRVFTHFGEIVNKVSGESVPGIVVGEAAAVINAYSCKCGDIEFSFAILVDEARPVVDESFTGCIMNKRILL
jgi:hypothetical protein